MQNLLVSIIVPCKDEKQDITGLREDISRQKASFITEVIKITNISPPGKARNMGAEKAKGKVVVFIDCDIRLGNDLVLANLIRPLIEDKTIGAVCSSVRIPRDASKFQILYAKEIPHCESPTVDKLTNVSVATSACCAIFKDVFFKIGGFNEKIRRGEDPEFSFRIRKAGYRTVLAPHTWCYHPLPGNIGQLIKINFRNGLAVSFADIFYPDLIIDVDPRGIVYFTERKNKLFRMRRFILEFINAIFKRKFLLISAKLIHLFGYLYGFFKYKIFHSFVFMLKV